jgi:FkbM family methyltransferase
VAIGRTDASTPLTQPHNCNSHSYQGQDLFVIEALGWLRDGFFVDSGASDGIHGSNTLLLESCFGWRGICVEPNDALFAKLTRSRRGICVNCCLYDRGGEVSFFEAAGVLGGIMDEYHPDLLRYARSLVASQPSAPQGAVTKPSRTIRSILREHHAPRVIDYWSLDTEGSELAILKSFPFDEYQVRVLTVEHNMTPVREEIHDFLESRGYYRARSLGIDDGYVLGALSGPRLWRSRVWSRARIP